MCFPFCAGSAAATEHPMIVVDASFAIEASMTRDGFTRLKGRDAVAPTLRWSEAASVLHELRWRNQISVELAETALRRLDRAPIRARRPARLLREAWNVANPPGLGENLRR